MCSMGTSRYFQTPIEYHLGPKNSWINNTNIYIYRVKKDQFRSCTNSTHAETRLQNKVKLEI